MNRNSNQATARTAASLLARNDQRTFLLVGLAFLVMASFLTIKELALGLGFTLGAVTLVAAFTSQSSHPGSFRLGASIAVLISALASSLVYAAGLQPLSAGFFVSPVLLLGCSLLWMYREQPIRDALAVDAPASDRFMHGLVWLSMTAALIILSWSLYFHFVTSSLPEAFQLRRLLLTAVWVSIGLAFYVRGRVAQHGAMMLSGLVFVCMACVKAAFYDTSHLEGFSRVAVLAFMGVVLTGTALYFKKRFAEVQPPAEEE